MNDNEKSITKYWKVMNSSEIISNHSTYQTQPNHFVSSLWVEKAGLLVSRCISNLQFALQKLLKCCMLRYFNMNL